MYFCSQEQRRLCDLQPYSVMLDHSLSRKPIHADYNELVIHIHVNCCTYKIQCPKVSSNSDGLAKVRCSVCDITLYILTP